MMKVVIWLIRMTFLILLGRTIVNMEPIKPGDIPLLIKDNYSKIRINMTMSYYGGGYSGRSAEAFVCPFD